MTLFKFCNLLLRVSTLFNFVCCMLVVIPCRLCLGTIIRNTGINFCVAQDMWLPPQTQYLAMGFPITLQQQVMTGSRCHCSRIAPEEDDYPSSRTQKSLRTQCGNSMHINSIGAAMFMTFLLMPSLGRRAPVGGACPSSSSSSSASVAGSVAAPAAPASVSDPDVALPLYGFGGASSSSSSSASVEVAGSVAARAAPASVSSPDAALPFPVPLHGP
jgi:hypothetical protein